MYVEAMNCIMHMWCCITNRATVRGIMVLIVCACECVILGRSVGFGSAPDSNKGIMGYNIENEQLGLEA